MAAKRTTHPPQVLQALVPQRPTLGVLILYAMGQLGWSLASYSVSNLLIYFYMPPEQGTPVFPAFVFQGAVLGILTLIGIVSAAGRLLDAVIDPLVANWSDRKQSGLGKRRWFLFWGALPFALSSFLVFYPLNHDESASNFVWLLGVIGVYYFFFAFYVIPYTALIAELGHTAKDRLLISTLLSVTWALGFIGGTQVYGIQSYLVSQGKTALEAFQMAILWINGIALVCMLLPALFLNEKKYARQAPSEHSIKQALKIVLGNQNFRWFLLSDLIYWISLNFIQLGVGFYTTLLLGLDIAYASVFSALGFLASFVFYAPINLMASRLGKKRLMLISFLLFAIIFGVLSFVQWIPVPKHFVLYGLAIASAFPLAVFGILPNALIGDEVEKEERLTGRQLSGMFYGVRAFVMKVGISLGNLVFPSLLLFGKSQDNPAGVQLTALAALAFCVAGWQVFRKYEETGG